MPRKVNPGPRSRTKRPKLAQGGRLDTGRVMALVKADRAPAGLIDPVTGQDDEPDADSRKP
jgi:hypothetical protein